MCWEFPRLAGRFVMWPILISVATLFQNIQKNSTLSSKSSYSLYVLKQCSLLTEFTWIPSQPTHIQLFPKTHTERILLITINLQDILIDIASSVKRGEVKLWVGYAFSFVSW